MLILQMLNYPEFQWDMEQNPGAVKATTDRMNLLHRFWWNQNFFIALCHWLSVNHYAWFISNFRYWLPWATWSEVWFNLTSKAFSNFQDFFVLLTCDPCESKILNATLQIAPDFFTALTIQTALYIVKYALFPTNVIYIFFFLPMLYMLSRIYKCS